MFGQPRQPIVIAGRPVGRLRASYILLKEGWRFLVADIELLLVPIVTAIMMIVLFAMLLLVVLVTGVISVSADASASYVTATGFLFLFGAYLISAFVVAFAKAMVTHTVSVRACHGNASFGDSFAVAGRRSMRLLLWSLLSATVGIIIRSISERSAFAGKLIAALLGSAWGILTYFVVPAMVIHNKGPIEAVRHSAAIFKSTWGETLVTNISLRLIFGVLHALVIIGVIAVLSLSVVSDLQVVFMGVVIAWIVWVFVAVAIQQILNAIITTLLYLYATVAETPANFDHELLAAMLARSGAGRPMSDLSAGNGPATTLV